MQVLFQLTFMVVMVLSCPQDSNSVSGPPALKFVPHPCPETILSFIFKDVLPISHLGLHQCITLLLLLGLNYSAETELISVSNPRTHIIIWVLSVSQCSSILLYEMVPEVMGLQSLFLEVLFPKIKVFCLLMNLSNHDFLTVELFNNNFWSFCLLLLVLAVDQPFAWPGSIRSFFSESLSWYISHTWRN